MGLGILLVVAGMCMAIWGARESGVFRVVGYVSIVSGTWGLAHGALALAASTIHMKVKNLSTSHSATAAEMEQFERRFNVLRDFSSSNRVRILCFMGCYGLLIVTVAVSVLLHRFVGVSEATWTMVFFSGLCIAGYFALFGAAQMYLRVIIGRIDELHAMQTANTCETDETTPVKRPEKA